MRKSELRKKRELQILSKLDKGGIMTAKQLRRIDAGGLGGSGIRNTLRILGEMEAKGLVVSRHVGMKLFRVHREGLKAREGFGFWEHTLMRNDFLIDKGWFDNAKMEVPIKKNGKELIRADAGVRVNGEWVFVEVDRYAKYSDNKEKVKKYRDLGLNLVVVCYKEREKFWKNLGVKVTSF